MLDDLPLNDKYDVLVDIGGQVGNAFRIPGNPEQADIGAPYLNKA